MHMSIPPEKIAEVREEISLPRSLYSSYLESYSGSHAVFVSAGGSWGPSSLNSSRCIIYLTRRGQGCLRDAIRILVE
jgi:hypothetical protein